MIRCLRDPDLWVRFKAVERLGDDRVREAVPPLARILTVRSNPILLRCATARALGRIGGVRAQTVLSKLPNDEERELHEAAGQALKGLRTDDGEVREKD